jgi:hypothetical protein
VGAARTPTLYLVIITYKVAVSAPAERADTLTLLHLYPICTLWGALPSFSVKEGTGDPAYGTEENLLDNFRNA